MRNSLISVFLSINDYDLQLGFVIQNIVVSILKYLFNFFKIFFVFTFQSYDQASNIEQYKRLKQFVELVEKCLYFTLTELSKQEKTTGIILSTPSKTDNRKVFPPLRWMQPGTKSVVWGCLVE